METNKLTKEERKEADRLKRQEEFINKFITKWGSENFDFSQTYYVNQNTPVTIICKEHGPTTKLPDQFIRKDIYPCQTCVKEKERLQRQEEFIQKAKEKFGEDRFDYSKIYYDTYHSKITVICNIHHIEYQVRADNFLKSENGGCPECRREIFSKKNTLTTEEFIERARKVHGNKYDYSKTVYNGNLGYVIVTCPIHGDFKITARSHLEGAGCRQCAIDSYRKPQEQFIKEVQEKHGNKFDLSKIKYINNYTDVEVICKKHNESFWIDPLILLTSNICCPKCRSEYKTKSLETFIEEARAVHGDKYDYSKVVYKSANEKVEIICPIHGSFYQKPSNHIHGQGCVKCTKKYQPTTEEYKQFLQDHFGDAYDYSKVVYINSSTPVEIVCPEHGSFFRKPCHIREVIRKGGSILCPHCSESEGEHKVFEFLKNKYIEYEKGKRFEKCVSISTLPFDFYLPDYNLCIEYQGAQHYSKDAYNRICCGSTKYGGFEGLQQRDQKKRDYCKENKISLLEIKFDIPLPKIGDKLDHLFKKLNNFPSSHIFLSLDEEKIEPY